LKTAKWAKRRQINIKEFCPVSLYFFALFYMA